MKELTCVDWSILRHAYGTGRETSFSVTYDCEKTLRDLASDDETVFDEAMTSVFSMLCHQGTIYEASAHAIPFLVAFLAGADEPRELTLVAVAIACIAGAASRPDSPHGSHAGAWGPGVGELTKRALELSADRIERCRKNEPDLGELFGLVLEVGQKKARDIELAKAIELAIEKLGAKRSADVRRDRLH